MENVINWENDFPSAITVCNKKGTILYMNNKSAITFEKYGGKNLIGKNIFDCHPDVLHSKLLNMLTQGIPNSYTIEKNGIKKLIHQSPWFENGEYKGFVELCIEIPMDMPHFMRK
jgi:transcriptional regulator with PAS, ATPase and Fis domain